MGEKGKRSGYAVTKGSAGQTGSGGGAQEIAEGWSERRINVNLTLVSEKVRRQYIKKEKRGDT